MKRFGSMMAALVAAGLVQAAAQVTAVAQDPSSRTVTVTYTLLEEAIVTLAVCTNGEEIGGASLATAWGDVWRRVPAGAGKRICWQPRTSFPGGVIADGSLTVRVRAWSLTNPPDYLVADLMMPTNLWWYASAEQLPYGLHSPLYKSAALVMRRVRACGQEWTMGLADGEAADRLDEDVPHPVVLTNDFYISVCKTTERQHRRICGEAVSGAAMSPQTRVSYAALRGAAPGVDWPATGRAVDAASLCGRLRQLTGVETFDLPTEAQWEYACRAGAADGLLGFSAIGEIAWCNDASVDWSAHGGNGVKSAQTVGLLAPNRFGLYDMLGNGFEWCRDYRVGGTDYALPGVLQIEPVGPVSSATGYRVLRSGSWDHAAMFSHPAYRDAGGAADYEGKYVTYRLVCGCDFR